MGNCATGVRDTSPFIIGEVNAVSGWQEVLDEKRHKEEIQQSDEARKEIIRQYQIQKEIKRKRQIEEDSTCHVNEYLYI